MHALVASPFKSAYNAAKHGIAGFTKTVALEVGWGGGSTMVVRLGARWITVGGRHGWLHVVCRGQSGGIVHRWPGRGMRLASWLAAGAPRQAPPSHKELLAAPSAPPAAAHWLPTAVRQTLPMLPGVCSWHRRWPLRVSPSTRCAPAM